MSIDVYSLCPCGSGKKLKFCCQAIVSEMEKAAKLMANDQSRAAVSLLEKLRQTHPDNAWIAVMLADILITHDEFQAAKDLLVPALKSHPDHALLYANYALASLFLDGYETAKPVIHRALQKCVTRFPRSAGFLASSVASMLADQGMDMALRQHIALALRLLDGAAREEFFMNLMQIDSERKRMYPLRSIHNLMPIAAEGARAVETAKANTLASIGCFGPAARAFSRLAEEQPGQFPLLYNAALCRAWDADETGASRAFRMASQAAPDFNHAVDCEVMAQLLDRRDPSRLVPYIEYEYPIKSASMLLTTLDAVDQMHRDPQSLDPDDSRSPVAVYAVLNRPLSQADAAESWDFHTTPRYVAMLTVFDRRTEEGSEVSLILEGPAGEPLESAKNLLESAATEYLSGPPTREETFDPHLAVQPHLLPITVSWFFPAGVPTSILRVVLKRCWTHLVDDVWINTPQPHLNNKSPRQAQGDAELRTALTAAVYVLDAFSEKNGYVIDVEAMLKRLDLTTLDPFEPTDNLAINTLTSLELLRLPLDRLSDAQLLLVSRRATVLSHRRFLEAVSKAVLDRPTCAAEVNVSRTYRTLFSLARDDARREEAANWLERARESAAGRDDSFAALLDIAVLETVFRFEDPDDPQLQPAFRQLEEYYAPKVPEVAEFVMAMRRQHAERFAWLRSAGRCRQNGMMRRRSARRCCAGRSLDSNERRAGGRSKQALASRPGMSAMPERFADPAAAMRRALELAAQGVGRVEPNPPVGAVLVDDALSLIAEGFHRQFGGPHAEIEAIQIAGSRAIGATLYVTLEPCCHQGKTGPCADVVIQAGIRRVVAAMQDPHRRVDGKGIARLREAGLEVEVGLLDEEAARLCAPFLKLVSTGRPWVHAKWAMTLDGKIATRTGDSKWISGTESRRIVHALRGRMDGILVGAGTVRRDDPLLTARPPGPRIATRIVVDAHAGLPLDSQLVRTAQEAPVMAIVSPAAPADRVDSLRQAGVEVLPATSSFATEREREHLRLDELLDELGRREMTNVLVEGGGELLGSFFDSRLVDEVHVFIAPKIAGGDAAVTPVAGRGIDVIGAAWSVEAFAIEQAGPDVYLNGRLRRPD